MDFSEKEKGKLKIEVRNEAKEIFKNYKFSDDQEIIENNSDNGTITVSLTPKSLDVCKWLLSFGANITPLSPTTIVAIWKEEIKKMYENLNRPINANINLE